MKNIAVFVSGNGTNLQAIIDAIARGVLHARVKLVVSDNGKAFALKRAKKAKIKTLVVAPKKFATKEACERFIMEHLKNENVEWIVLAGFMRILSPLFVKKYRMKIVNIHPALLPSFKGAHAIKDAYDAGAKVTGVTVHFVDEKVDHGPIIAQESVGILDTETLQELEARIHKVEHRLYVSALEDILCGRIKICGRQTR